MSLWKTIQAVINSSGTVVNVRADPSTSSLQMIEYEHHEIHNGSHYIVDNYADLSINQVLDFTWQMPDTTKQIHWTWNLSTEAKTIYQVYEIAIATNPLANVIVPINSNRNSLNISDTIMRFEIQANLAAANADTDVSGATLIQQGVLSSGKELDFRSREHEIIMKRNTLYCLRSTASVAGYQHFTMQWYEHTPHN